jgi:seryl-tRNA synthetase
LHWEIVINNNKNNKKIIIQTTMLDINLFREEKGGNPGIIRESQRRRFADETIVDQIIQKDHEWRQMRGRLDILNNYSNQVSKTVGIKKKAKEEVGDETLDIPQQFFTDLDAQFDKEKGGKPLNELKVTQLMKLSKHIKALIAKLEQDMKEKEQERDNMLYNIGNIVHESCVISNNEDENGIVREWGEHRQGENLLNHVDIMEMLDNMHCEQGAKTAGARGYYLTGGLVRLNLALQNYAMDFLQRKGFVPIYVPFFMDKKTMAKVAQLADFDEQLYKVTGEGDDKYLIATSEQPIAAFHLEEWIDDKRLPIKYAGVSTCFRKEVGSHGKDTLGIFRVHQFEKIEQFVICSPKDGISWKMMDEMIGNSEEFYQSLGLSYRVVNIVSGALNNAAAKKLDLEAWFPASKTFRELVSCSNCTDYQARRLKVRFGASKNQGAETEYVHMLNSTLSATSRTMCCLVENYQTPDGIKIPEVLQKYMGGIDFLPFVKPLGKKK